MRARGDDFVPFVRAATLAANAHNTQPWLFKIRGSRIELFADTARNAGAVDPFVREMHISLGCALENLVVAAARGGYTASIALVPGALGPISVEPTPHVVATVDLERGARAERAELFDAIPRRHTNRGPMDPARPLPDDFVSALQNLPQDDAVRLFTFTSQRERDAIVELTDTETLVVYRDPAVVADGKKWWRTSHAELERRRDGFLVLPPDPGAPRPPSHKSIMASAPLFGIVAVRDRYEQSLALRAGRVYERAHLVATGRGVATRVDNAAVEKVDYERRLERQPVATSQLAAVVGDPVWQPTLIFYMGYALEPEDSSPRRPVADVLL